MHWLPRKTVVVPIDFSDDAFAALETAGELAADRTDLHIVHVLPLMEPTDPGIIWATVDDESRRENASEALHKELADRGFDGIEVVIRFGDPGHEIATYAKETKAGLVVVSSHGQTALRHLLIGSVAERVVRLAHCPVLVLKQ
ncbi:MAG: universal stress protein [Thermoguttaceae bacterium]